MHFLTVADFSTLYTNLTHSVIKDAIFFLLDRCFHNAGTDNLCVNNVMHGRLYKVWYLKNNQASSNAKIFNLDQVKLLVSNVIDQTFVYFGN